MRLINFSRNHRRKMSNSAKHVKQRPITKKMKEKDIQRCPETGQHCDNSICRILHCALDPRKRGAPAR